MLGSRTRTIYWESRILILTTLRAGAACAVQMNTRQVDNAHECRTARSIAINAPPSLIGKIRFYIRWFGAGHTWQGFLDTSGAVWLALAAVRSNQPREWWCGRPNTNDFFPVSQFVYAIWCCDGSSVTSRLIFHNNLSATLRRTANIQLCWLVRPSSKKHLIIRHRQQIVTQMYARKKNICKLSAIIHRDVSRIQESIGSRTENHESRHFHQCCLYAWPLRRNNIPTNLLGISVFFVLRFLECRFSLLINAISIGLGCLWNAHGAYNACIASKFSVVVTVCMPRWAAANKRSDTENTEGIPLLLAHMVCDQLCERDEAYILSTHPQHSTAFAMQTNSELSHAFGIRCRMLQSNISSSKRGIAWRYISPWPKINTRHSEIHAFMSTLNICDITNMFHVPPPRIGCRFLSYILSLACCDIDILAENGFPENPVSLT